MSKRLFCFAVEYTESLSIFNITVNVDEKVDDPYPPLCYHAEDGLTKEQWHVLASPLQVLAMDKPADHHTVYPRFRDEVLHCRGGAFVYDDEEHSPGLVERAKRHILDAVCRPVFEVCQKLQERAFKVTVKLDEARDRCCPSASPLIALSFCDPDAIKRFGLTDGKHGKEEQ